jgi:hypothetical protein
METAEILKKNYRELMTISSLSQMRAEITKITNGCQIVASILTCNCLDDLRHAVVDFIFSQSN